MRSTRPRNLAALGSTALLFSDIPWRSGCAELQLIAQQTDWISFCFSPMERNSRHYLIKRLQFDFARGAQSRAQCFNSFRQIVRKMLLISDNPFNRPKNVSF